MNRGYSILTLGLFFLTGLTGCGGAPAPAKGAHSEVKQVGLIYTRFLGSHRGKAPANRDEFETFLKAMKPEDLKAMGIENPTSIFQSSRDGAEIGIRYGIEVPPPQPGNPTVVAYEQKGVGGKHLVAYGSAGVEEISAARLKELVPDKK